VQALREKKILSLTKIYELWDDRAQIELALKTLLADGLIETTGKSVKLAD